MKVKLVLLAAFAYCSAAAQPVVTYKYWVGFTDKKGTPYTIERPAYFLSAAAIARKKKQQACVDETDLPVSPQYTEKFRTMEGVELRHTSRWMNGVIIYLNDTTHLPAIRQFEFVREVLPIGVDRLSAQMEAGFREQEASAIIEATAERTATQSDQDSVVSVAYSKAFYGKAYQQIAMCNGHALHQKGYTGKQVKIAVLDAGFSNFHLLPALKPLARSERLIGARDLVQLNDTVFDDDDHGTNVLSCMAAWWPGKMVGTAPDASYLLLRTEDASTEYLVEEYNWLIGAELADSAGADIITSSLGYTTFDDKRSSHTRKELDGKTAVISRAAAMAARKGLLVVNSAGNEGDGLWRYIGVPADADSIFTIGAVDAKGGYASFSSLGPTQDKRVKPTLSTMGEMTMVLSPYGVVYPSNGTSFSAPVFAGMLACLYQANPNQSIGHIMQALIKSGSQYAFPDIRKGYGIPDFKLANKILGGDPEYPLTSDILLDVSIPVNSPYLTLTFHSVTTQQLRVELIDGKKKTHYHATFSIQPGQTERYFIKKFRKLKKGKYQLLIRSANIDYTADVIKK
jgi:hypothetical protein